MVKALVYILIVTKYGRKKEVSNKLLKFKEIEDVHEIFGQYDIIAKVSAPDMRRLEDFIQKNIRSIKEIEGTQTLVVSDIPSK
ncbi:Lrp/AsnC ligand binding domain-containing protein [Candidatus Woesearchaeota archaeon]|nr:Lrp/AsnC ligand binding domain-containing protein [Candidatus Woesearchaeota archaeon]